MTFVSKYVSVLLLALALFGCGSEQEVSAEDVAIAFFDALYNQKDLPAALSYTTPALAQKLSQYKTARQVAKRVFNMSYDKVKIDVALGDIQVRKEFQQSGSLTILFTGSRQEKIYKELKKIKLVKKQDTWLVDELLPDPMPN